MAKYEQPYEDTTDLYDKIIEKTGLKNYINITVLNNSKAKEIFKVNKANELLKYRTNDDVIIVINENAMDKLTPEQKEMVVVESLASIHYNVEKDRLEISKPDVVTFSGILSKYGFENWNNLRETINLLFQSEKQTQEETA
jgi:hypothetical protein